MSEPDVPLAAEFEPPTREAWLKLVEQGAEGRRLREAAGFAHGRRPRHPAALHPRRRSRRAARHRRARRCFPGRLGHPPAPRRARSEGAPMPPSWTTSRAASPRCCCRSRRPGRRASPMAPRRWRRRSRACSSTPAPSRSTRARTRMDAAGSLIEIWRAAKASTRTTRRGAFNYDPLGVLASTGTLYYPAGSLLRDRRQARRRLPHHVARARRCSPTAGPITRPAPARRRSWPPCWQRWSPTCAPARRRGCRPRMALGQDRARRWRPMPTCS